MAKNQEVVLSGKNIYYDKHKRAIYFNKRKGIAYVIPKEFEGTFQTLSYRYVVGVIGFIFSQLIFQLNLLVSLIIGIACWAILEFRYQKALSSMTQIKNFKPEEAKSSSTKVAELSTSGIMLRGGLYLALAILLIVNLYTTKGLMDNIAIVIASCGLSLAALYMAIRMAISLKRKSAA